MKRVILLSAMLMVMAGLTAKTKNAELKPRLVVLTDIGDCDVEPDDMESAVRLMTYADCFEIEAIMTTVGWNCDPYPEEWTKFLDKVVDAYSIDVYNLRQRSSQKSFLPLKEENGKQRLGYWPSAEYIHSRTMAGSHRAGIGVIGEGNDSEGSDFLIRLADEDDDRPIWVAAWGGGNTLAQAIWRVKQTRTAEELKAFLRKFRIYTITDQDMVYAMRMNRAYSSHRWMLQEFKDDLKFIWDEGTWQLHVGLGVDYWHQYERQVQGHGALGRIYPKYKYGVEGDTPSFLYVMPNGLSDPEDPSQAGWGGCHAFGLCADSLTHAWTSWQEPMKSITEGYKRRFYPDELNDFCARMQWASEGMGNKNPVVVVRSKSGRMQGKVHSPSPIHIKVAAGSDVLLDASKSSDPDGDHLDFLWWQQPEASTYAHPVDLSHTEGSSVRISVPRDASGKTIHIVCEVHDSGPFRLVAYKRIILDVE